MIKNKKHSVILILTGLFILIVLSAVPLKNRFTTNTTPSPSQASPAIPASSEGAKDYIARASLEAQENRYDQAIEILEEGILHYPDDQNLQLTLQYYEDQQQRYVQ